MSGCRAVVSVYRAFSSRHPVFFLVNKALLSVCRALLSVRRTLVSVYEGRVYCEVYICLLSMYIGLF